MDAWFASVRTAIAVYEKGHHFTGKIKNGKRDYPMDMLQNKLLSKHETHSVSNGIKTVDSETTMRLQSN